MGKLLYMPPVKHHRWKHVWKRSPLYWAARRSWEALIWAHTPAFLVPSLFLSLFTIACLARLPFRWRLVEVADEFVREVGEYA